MHCVCITKIAFYKCWTANVDSIFFIQVEKKNNESSLMQLKEQVQFQWNSS